MHGGERLRYLCATRLVDAASVYWMTFMFNHPRLVFWKAQTSWPCHSVQVRFRDLAGASCECSHHLDHQCRGRIPETRYVVAGQPSAFSTIMYCSTLRTGLSERYGIRLAWLMDSQLAGTKVVGGPTLAKHALNFCAFMLSRGCDR